MSNIYTVTVSEVLPLPKSIYTESVVRKEMQQTERHHFTSLDQACSAAMMLLSACPSAENADAKPLNKSYLKLRAADWGSVDGYGINAADSCVMSVRVEKQENNPKLCTPYNLTDDVEAGRGKALLARI